MDSTLAAARAIVLIPTLHEREAKLLQIAPAFRSLVALNVAYMLAGEICALSTKDDRNSALAEVPGEIRAVVESIVGMRFAAARELRGRMDAAAGSLQ